MTVCTIVDTGPLVAFFSQQDAHHDWATDQLGRLSPPLLTCEPVLTETCYLVASAGGNPNDVLDFAARGGLKIDFKLSAELEAVRRLMARYRDIGISLADACLVRMSELHARCEVLTLDTDFLVYRRDGRRTIPLIAPFGG